MSILALVRHGPTRWTEAGRIQGRTDVALSAAGRAAVRRWRLPTLLDEADWTTSPLLRTVQTARLLGAVELAFEPRLVEMCWGDWEGQTLTALRAADTQGMAENEARGLAFAPPGGESPRQVQQRLAPWLAAIANRPRPVLAVTHKGVIRAVFAWAAQWPMLGKPPVKLDWSSAHLFRIAPDGTPSVERLNLSLLPPEKAAP